ncbi:bifunctional phosphoribosylaminoimidazolecarboxamide formyltransferase/IMP cyclohydrolase [bacterium]|nr:bifunctional phosphoribosylaminoimidazolecarboxamide formyltransferase/IMP cyclohydrolase [bacterium]
MPKIKRALISVSDKTGIDEFAKGLSDLGVEIISTGGTAKKLKDAGIPIRSIQDFTGFPEMMDGRVKTLHPKVHAGLLALRDNPEHMKEIKEKNIELIDMVVVNLYPFKKTLGKKGVSHEEVIENIDIGGPTMLRSGAKNYKSVAIICNPERYDLVLEEMRENDCNIGEDRCQNLACEVFEHTSTYDNAIYHYFESLILTGEEGAFPKMLEIGLEKIQDLRYGENPHQRAAFYSGNGLAGLKKLHGKELSFNNIIDLDAAFNIVQEFDQPVAVIIKHTNPCGVACDKVLKDAYRKAHSCDPVSAFGSVVGFNREVDGETAGEISDKFVEAIIAPEFSEDALKILEKKKNIRLIEYPGLSSEKEVDSKKVFCGLLIQDKDKKLFDGELKFVTKRKPTDDQMKALRFAWKVCKHVKSNAIVYVNDEKTVGIGAGQMSRVDSSELAIMKAKKSGLSIKGTVLASDAFFPFRDAVDAAVGAGVAAIIQPGGSQRDEEVITACNEHDIAMVFTGIRHFKH